MLNNFLRFIDRFIPDIWKQDGAAVMTGENAEHIRKSRLLVGFTLFSAPMVFVMFFVRLAAENKGVSPTIVALPIIGTILILNLVWLKKYHSYRTGILVTLIATGIVVPFRALHTGGMSSTVLMWTFVLPVWSAMMIGARASFICSILNLLSMILIAWPGLLGINFQPVPLVPMAQFVVAAIAMLTCTGFVMIYEIQRHKYHTELTAQSYALKREKAQTETLNQLLATMLNSVGQGFLIFDAAGSCFPTYSRACETLLGHAPAGKKIWDVLDLTSDELKTFRLWMHLLFQGHHEFSNLRTLGPQERINRNNRHIRFEYFPVYEGAKLTAVVMVSTDITEEIKAKEQAAVDRAHASMIIKMARNNYAFVRFNQSLTYMLKQFETDLNRGPEARDHLARIMHTIKGTAGTLSMIDVAHLAHKLENLVNQSNESVVSQRKLIDANLSMIRSAHQAALKDFQSISGSEFVRMGRHIRRLSDDQLRQFYDRLCSSKDPRQLADEYLKAFIKEPASRFFTLYDELVQDLSRQLFKQVKPLRFVNGGTLIDPEAYHPLFESFVHIFRNAIDHGIELPAKRQDLGKDPAGEITVSVSKYKKGSGDWLKIEIADDGRGINSANIRERLLEKGRAEDLKSKTDDQILQLIFSPNFSTATEVTELSGRGVGLDAVMNEARKLDGTIRVESELGRGSRFIIDVPDIVSVSQHDQVA